MKNRYVYLLCVNNKVVSCYSSFIKAYKYLLIDKSLFDFNIPARIIKKEIF